MGSRAAKSNIPINDMLKELQDGISSAEMIARLSKIKGSQSNNQKFLVMPIHNIELRMEGDKRHARPHLHLKIGKRSHAATYSIDGAEKLAGTRPRQEREVREWILKYKADLLQIWNATQAGENPQPYITILEGKQ